MKHSPSEELQSLRNESLWLDRILSSSKRIQFTKSTLSVDFATLYLFWYSKSDSSFISLSEINMKNDFQYIFQKEGLQRHSFERRPSQVYSTKFDKVVSEKKIFKWTSF